TIIAVLDREGRTVYSRAPIGDAQRVLSVQFRDTLPDWRLVVYQTPGASARQAVQRQVMFFTGALGVLVAVIVAGIVTTWRLMRRETEMARLKSDFVANVSHDLKTPLSVIRMFGETLEMGRVTDEGRRQEYYRVITREGERLTRLIDNVLDVSRIEGARQTYRTPPTAAEPLVRGTLETFADATAQQASSGDVRGRPGDRAAYRRGSRRRCHGGERARRWEPLLTSLAARTVLMAKILIVDDEPEIVRGLEDNLRFEGYQTASAANGEDALALALSGAPDLILLDVTMPQMSGWEVCRALRAKGVDVPVIMLTARGEEVDRVRGLELGADDYVTKPFSLRELLARVRAVLRRPGPRERFEEFAFGDVRVRPRVRQVFKAGHEVRLTRKEFDLLVFLIAHRGEVITRERLLDEVWG